MATLEESVGAPVPDEVIQSLRKAYGSNCVGKTGYELAGHKVEQRNKLQVAAGSADASLQYGELLPEGAAKAFQRLGICGAASESVAAGVADADTSGIVLELGMGTGILAMQVFLQCRCLRGVVGIEVSEARCAVAVAAAAQLCAAEPERYRAMDAVENLSGDLGTQEVKERCRILEKAAMPLDPSAACGADPGESTRREEQDPRWLQLIEGDLGQLTPETVKDARAIFLQVVLSESARRSAQQLLQHAPDGCRAFILDDMRTTWALEQPSIFHALPDCDAGVDRYATSWNPSGHRFYIFEADRTRKATITQDSAAWALAIAEADGHEL